MGISKSLCKKTLFFADYSGKFRPDLDRAEEVSVGEVLLRESSRSYFRSYDHRYDLDSGNPVKLMGLINSRSKSGPYMDPDWSFFCIRARQI
jgi:hypothetical protein